MIVGKYNIIFIVIICSIWWFGKIDTWTFIAIMVSTMRILDKREGIINI